MAERNIQLSDYAFAIICALPKELAAAKAMLDEIHPEPPPVNATQCAFTLGRIGGHNIVLACLPAGVYGTTSATAVVSYLQTTFPSIRYGLMVGIGGGVPSKTADIRLGDVVVSKPTGTSSGVVQYDFGKMNSGGHFQHTGILNQPPIILLTAIAQLEASEKVRKSDEVSKSMAHVLSQYPDMEAEFSRPQGADHLFDATYEHVELEATCTKCDPEKQVLQSLRRSTEPRVHYGTIASGNQVVKAASNRDQIAGKLNALCFEMEAAGIMNHLPCLVIRGICDYCDSHKNKQWQGYAALTAAAYAKLLLSFVPVTYSPKIQTMRQGLSILPFNRNPQFLGRDSEIDRLEKFILAQNRTRKAAIAGLGGVGKTQIALELAYCVRDQNPKYSVFWIRSTNMEAVEKSFIDICDALGLPRTPSSDPKLQVKTYLSERAGHWLLIVDNADEMDLWMSSQSSSPTLTTILPQSPNGFTVFTTRNQKLATRLAAPQVIRVSELSNNLAMDLLRTCLIEEDRMNDTESAKILVHQLGGLPLALIQAASFINQNLISLKGYLSLLSEQEDTKVELLSEDFDDDYQYEDVQNPVSATWLISFEQICKADSLATEYLSRIACIDPRDIPLSIFPPNCSVVKQQKALGTLKAYSFISEMADVQFVNMHQLVHLATRNWLRSKGVIEDWTIRTGEYLSEIFPSCDPSNRIVWRWYLPHAQYILQSENFPWKTAGKENLSQNTAQCLYADGRYREAVTLFKSVLNRRTQHLKNGDPRILMSMEWLASTYGKLGQRKEAEELAVQVMNTTETVLSVEHLDISLANMNNRASIRYGEGQLKEAEKLLIQAVDMHKTVLGAEDHGTLTCMANLGSIYKSEGRWKEAEELFIQVMYKHKKVLGAEHPDTLTNMENIATTYSNQGRWKEAEELAVQVMNTRRAVLGTEHPDILTSMANLASTYGNQGRLKEAEELLIQAVDTSKTTLGVEHHDTLASTANLAWTYSNQGRWKEAEELEVQVMDTRKKVLGPEHPDTLTSMANLASTYSNQNQGRLKEAEELFIQVIDKRRAVLGVKHPDTLTSMANLASTYSNQGRLKEAEELGVQVMGTRKTVLGAEHPDTLISMWSLAHTMKHE